MEALVQQMAAGDLNWATGLAWAGVAWVLSLLGGALTGLMMASEDIGRELSVTLGGAFGTTIGAPAVVIGLLVLAVG